MLFILVGGLVVVCLVVSGLLYINKLLSLNFFIDVIIVWDGVLVLVSLVLFGIIIGFFFVLVMVKLLILGDI